MGRGDSHSANGSSAKGTSRKSEGNERSKAQVYNGQADNLHFEDMITLLDGTKEFHLKQMDAPFKVKHLTGLESGKAGDYLAQDDVGTTSIIREEAFQTRFQIKESKAKPVKSAKTAKKTAAPMAASAKAAPSSIQARPSAALGEINALDNVMDDLIAKAKKASKNTGIEPNVKASGETVSLGARAIDSSIEKLMADRAANPTPADDLRNALKSAGIQTPGVRAMRDEDPNYPVFFVSAKDAANAKLLRETLESQGYELSSMRTKFRYTAQKPGAAMAYAKANPAEPKVQPTKLQYHITYLKQGQTQTGAVVIPFEGAKGSDWYRQQAINKATYQFAVTYKDIQSAVMGKKF